MKLRTMFAIAVVSVLLAAPALAVQPGTDVIVPAASRGAGAAPSVWITTLYIYNPNATAANVQLYWLVRGQSNPSPASVALAVGPGDTSVLDDVILNTFGQTSGNGAFRVVSDQVVMVNGAILNTAGGTEFGQAFEGIPTANAVAAGSTTNVVGLKNNATYRTNVFIIDASGSGSQAVVELLDTTGAVLASKTYTQGAFQPTLEGVSALGGPNFDNGTLRVTVNSGAVMVGASRVNQTSGDPLTLASWWSCGGGGGGDLTVAGTYYGAIADPTGSLGGMILTVDGNGNVTSIDFSFPSDKANCTFFFGGGGEFTTPIPLSDFINPGVAFTNSYTGGEMTWTVQLSEDEANLFYLGSMGAEGAGWTGENFSCNGVFPADTLSLGKDQ